MQALAIFYPQFHKTGDDAPTHEDICTRVDTLVARFGVARTLEDGTAVPAMLDESLLRRQQGDYFAVAAAVAGDLREMDEAPAGPPPAQQARRVGGDEPVAAPKSSMTRYWTLLSKRPNFESRLGEWGKGAEIAIAMVGGSVADERTFSYMNMVTGDQRNSLTEHLELCVRFWEQREFTLQTFPFAESIKEELY